MTYLELCQKFRRSVGIAGSGPTSVTGQTGIYELVVDWIADADQMIQEMWVDWAFLWATKTFTTTSGDNEYTLGDLSLSTGSAALSEWDPSSFVVDPTGSWGLLNLIEYRDYRLNQKLGTVPTGKPNSVVIRPDSSIILYPTPDAAYTITADYQKRPTRMSANSDVSPIPSQFHDVIIYRAKMMYGEYEEAPEVYQSAQVDFQAMMRVLEAHSLPQMHFQNRSDTSAYDLTVRVE